MNGIDAIREALERGDDELVLRSFMDQEALDLHDLVDRITAWAAAWGSGREESTRAAIHTGLVELTDDDGGNGTNSRLEETLPAGHYTVDVSSLNNGAGMVEVRVQVDGASADGAAASAARAAADAAAVADDAAAVEAASR